MVADTALMAYTAASLLALALPALGVLAGLGAKTAIDVVLEGRRWRREDRLRDRDEKRRAYREAFLLLGLMSEDRAALAEPGASEAERQVHHRNEEQSRSLLVDLQFLAPTAVTGAYLQALEKLTSDATAKDVNESLSAFLAECRLDLGQRRRRE